MVDYTIFYKDAAFSDIAMRLSALHGWDVFVSAFNTTLSEGQDVYARGKVVTKALDSSF